MYKVFTYHYEDPSHITRIGAYYSEEMAYYAMETFASDNSSDCLIYVEDKSKKRIYSTEGYREV